MKRKLFVKMGIFGACPITILQDPNVTPTALKCYIALMSFEGVEKESYPSREKISERSGIKDLAKVTKAIRVLQETGWVRVIQRGKKLSNIYICCVQVDPCDIKSEMVETTTTPESEMVETTTTEMVETTTSILKDHLKDHEDEKTNKQPDPVAFKKITDIFHKLTKTEWNGKERMSVKRIIEMCHSNKKQTETEVLLKLNMFRKLQESDKSASGYWRNSEPVPSILYSRWNSVVSVKQVNKFNRNPGGFDPTDEGQMEAYKDSRKRLEGK